MPEHFGKLQELVHLNLSKNQFNLIPKAICELKKLKYLFMQSNILFELDSCTMGNLAHVYKINLSNNPIVVSTDCLQVLFNIILKCNENSRKYIKIGDGKYCHHSIIYSVSSINFLYMFRLLS